ncbi:putative cyclase [Trametes polyzona]|nr:putative cyclase [Trametes polyzona]
MSPEYVDLSQPLDENVQIYPGDPAFSCCPVQTIEKDGINLHQISLGSHTGTHVDAPYHFVQDGARIDTIPLASFVGNAVIIDVTSKNARETINWADISSYEDTIRRKAAQPHGVFVLLNTGWSRHWQSDMYFEHPFLAGDACQRLVDLGVKLVGVDTLSPDETRVDGSMPDFDAHHIVLGAGVLIAENLTNLEAIRSGDWLVSLAPLKLKGCDGSPVRAFAWRTGHEPDVSTRGTTP